MEKIMHTVESNDGSKSKFNFIRKHFDIFMFSLSLLFILAGTLLVLFSDKFIPVIYDLLSNKVFHREFRIEKWLPTIQSFLIVPLFIVICFNSFIFHKYSDKYKTLFLFLISLCIMFFVCFTVGKSLPNCIDGDLASETLLAKECVREKSPVPLGWCYSTEIRLLNTQLISAPVFIFTNNWNIVRAFTSFFACIILGWSCWFLLSSIGVKKTWLKFLGASLLACPWSSLHFYVIGWGNYYIPHIVFGFITLSVFIRIMKNKAKNRKRLLFIFYLLAFISGLSTIRYILIYLVPLFISILILSLPKEKITRSLSFKDIKQFLIENKNLLITFIALVFSGAGYLFNNIILHSLYHFSQWNDVTFNFFGDVTVGTLISTIIKAFGYQENIAVFTPGGVLNILVYSALAFFIFAMVKSLKQDLSDDKKLILVFTVCTILFNSFLYFHTEFIERFYITVLAYMIPCIVIFIENLQLSVIVRYFVGVLFSICIFSSSYTSAQSYLTSNQNKDIQNAVKYLNQKVKEDSDYSFGYSTFDFANMITYFSDEKIEVACVKKIHKDGKDMLPSKFIPGTWLTPVRYNNYKHTGKIFFFISKNIYESSSASIFENSEKVYDDGKYLIFEYKSQEDFKKAFNSESM